MARHASNQQHELCNNDVIIHTRRLPQCRCSKEIVLIIETLMLIILQLLYDGYKSLIQNNAY